MAARIRLLCVDDHEIVREGIARILGREHDCDVVALASTGEEAVALFLRHRPDVVLMDLQLPIMTGLEAIRQIRLESPKAKIIALTIFDGVEDIFRALDVGAGAFLSKDTISTDLVRVVREIHDGRYRPSEAVEARLRERSTQSPLSPREIQVVTLIAQGQRNKEVADTLGISEDTVRVYMKKLLAKLKVKDRAAAVSTAIRRGIIHIRDVQ